MTYHTQDAFDSRMEQRRSSPTPLRKHAVFYHISCMNHWRTVVKEQLRLCRFSGLTDIFACVIGQNDEIQDVREIALAVGINLTILSQSDDLSQCERPTINALWKWCRENPDGALTYFHTKGVTAPPNTDHHANKTQWRRLMSKDVIHQWQRNLTLLETADIVGVCWEEDREWPHFCGNFWAARADWVANLQNPEEYRVSRPDFTWAGGSWRDRFWVETWVGSQPWHHIESLVCRNEELWTDAVYRHDVSISGFDWDASTDENLRSFFDKVYVINLSHRPDRLEAFRANLRECGWPFQEPEVWPGVPGSTGLVPCPEEFTEGGGAFGCRQSHCHILEDCLMSGIGSVLILEDDAYIQHGFAEKVASFLARVPSDWQGIMLGGQHHSDPKPIYSDVVKVTNAQRTHAYAARGDYLRGLYQRWACATVHIDWLMSGWQHQFNVYAPTKWLIGQSRSRSDICGRTNAATTWNDFDASEYQTLYLLNVTRSIKERLAKLGYHCGYSTRPDGIDEGLWDAMQNPEGPSRKYKLAALIHTLQKEAIDGELKPALWYPGLTLKGVKGVAKSEVVEVSGRVLDEILATEKQKCSLSLATN